MNRRRVNRYARFLFVEEFTRLAALLRDVAPSVILTIAPLELARCGGASLKRPVAICF
jgi:hypothetical protein